MKQLKQYFSILIGKFIIHFLKLFNLGATAAPGLYALKIDKNIIKKLTSQLKFSIIVSGTNGKTTTARIIATILKQAEIKYYHNRTGSNLQRGVVSELLNHYKSSGLPKNRLGLWEIDEAVLPTAIKNIRPKIIILLNLFRDQLDRYGEIDTLASKWKQALIKLPKSTTLILNADDPTIASLGKNLKCKVVYFGIKDITVGSKTLSHASDATMCPTCLNPLNYQTCFVSHLGIFNCPNCNFNQPKLNFSADNIKVLNNGHIEVKTNQYNNKITIKLPGIYNVYNLLAAITTAESLNINKKHIFKAIKSFKPAFGRFEHIKVNNKNLKILLVKNPTGFNQVLTTLSQLSQKQPFSCLILLKDLIADGRDVSWIWDVDLEELNKINNLDNIIISGLRAEDMALRLKYSGKKVKNKIIQTEKDFKKAITTLLKQKNKNLFILPTYTAMLRTRKILNKMNLIHSTWED